jgi:hypothetical protein
VKKALYQIASRLHDNPSRSQHLLTSAAPNVYQSGGSLMGPGAGAPIVGIAPLMGPYGGYKGDTGDWSRSLYSAPRDEASSKEFSLRVVCPTGNIGGVIGKGGAIINQIRQESGAVIKVDSSTAEGDDCLITISSKEVDFLYVLWACKFRSCIVLTDFQLCHFSFLKTHILQV